MESLNKNILAISWAMPPLLFPRALQISRLLKEWKNQGWNTTVLTANPDSVKGIAILDKELESFYKRFYTTVPVHSPEGSLFLRGLFRFAPFLKQMPDERRLWAGNAYRKAIETHVESPASVLVSFAQPWSSHLVGLWLRQKTGLPWVAHFSDPWTVGSHTRMSAWEARQASLWEKRVVEAATRLVFVTQEAADATLARYPVEFKRKIRVVPHGFDRDILSALPPSASSTPSKLRLVHTGHFYGPRTPWALLEALAGLNTLTPLRDVLEIHFVGYVPAHFLAQANARGLEGVITSSGTRSYFESLQALRGADALLLIEAPSSENNLYFPSKLVDYFLFQKPIFALTPLQGTGATLLRQMQCPIAEPTDIQGIQHAIKDLLNQKRLGPLRVSDAFTAATGAFDIRRTAATFQTILEEVQRK